MKRLLLLTLLVLSIDDELIPPSIQALWSGGARVEAVEQLASEFDSDSQNRELGAALVQWEIAIHRYQAAWSHLEQLGPDQDRVRGKVLYLLGQYRDALEFLDGRDPDQTLARLDSLEVLGRMEAAKQALELAAEVLGANHPRVRTSFGRAFARESKFEQAAGEFRAALEVDAFEQEARFGLGRALIALGKRDEGLKVLEEHRRLIPLIDRLEFARQSLDIEPTHAPNHADVGDCQRALGRIDAARAAYQLGLNFAEPGEVVPISLRLARLHVEDRKDLNQALALLDRSFAVVADPRLLVRAGDYLRASGRFEDAIAHYERALEIRPTDRAIEKRLSETRVEQSSRESSK